jgi:F-type H+-transporting ATPase subunit delta
LNVKVVVDPTVIGGLVATIGDEVIDDTIRTRLDNVKSRL